MNRASPPLTAVDDQPIDTRSRKRQYNTNTLIKRLRRGTLCGFAREHGMTKISLGHHLDDFTALRSQTVRFLVPGRQSTVTSGTGPPDRIWRMLEAAISGGST